MFSAPEGLKKDVLYIAVDPSFKGFGCAVCYNGQVKLFQTSVSEGVTDPNQLLRHSMALTANVWKTVAQSVTTNAGKIVMIIEVPPPRGSFTAGLNFLVGSFATATIHMGASLSPMPMIEIYGTSALTIKSIHGSRKATKQDSIELASSFFEDKDMTHNMADAAILLLYLFQTVLKMEVIKNAESAQRFSRPQFSRLI